MSKHLLINALHREESFLARGMNRVREKLNQLKQEVDIRDLYKMDFNPVLTSGDLSSLKRGELPGDIMKEQEYIRESTYLWFIFPVWWTSMPAMLKGYIDRVFLNGFAYTLNENRIQGLLNDKKVIILNSMGESKEHYENEGMFQAIEKTIDDGIFHFCGMKVIHHLYYTSIMSASEESRIKYLEELEEFVVYVVNQKKEKSQEVKLMKSLR